MKLVRLLLCALAGASLLVSTAFAQSWPTRPLRIVVGFAPGGGGDILSRIFAAELEKALGQAVIVENRPGANGHIGMNFIAKSAPDGYNIGFALLSTVTDAFLKKDMPYDLWSDIAPVVLFASSPNVFVVHPDVPAKTLKEFIDLVKANPGKFNYGTPGNGSPQQLFQELLNFKVGGLKINHVPYKGGAPSMAAVVANEVQSSMVSTTQSLPLILAGKLRALAITTAQRNPLLPNVPSIAEVVPGYTAEVWYGFVVRAGTPPAIINRLNSEVNRINKTPAVAERFAKLGAIRLGVGGSPADFGNFMKAEAEKWRELFKNVPIKVD